MKGYRVEPGLLRIFRYFSGGVTLAFLFLLLVPDSSREGNDVSLRTLLLFAITYAAIFLYLFIPKLEKRMKNFYLLPALIASSLIPIAIINAKFQTLLNLNQPINTLEDTITLTNLLIFPLIVTAWQYSFFIVFLFFVVFGFLDPLLLILINDGFTQETYMAFNASIIRILGMGAVGFMITELRSLQRTERKKLEDVNRKLEEYARTNERLAVSRERNRLARELHDTLAHTLSGLAIQLEAADAVITEGGGESKSILDRARGLVRDGLGETRRALRALRASPLEELGLFPALRSLIQKAVSRGRFEVKSTFPDVRPDWPGDVEESLYRIVQEGLENVLRHAEANRVLIHLEGDSERLNLRFSDDGRGFDLGTLEGDGHFGMWGMRERAAAAGGRWTVESHRGKGTVLLFNWEKIQ